MIDQRQMRRKRIGSLFATYWAGTWVAGLLLPSGGDIKGLQLLVQGFVSRLDGVMQVVSRSYDPPFVEVFVALSLLWAVTLAITSFWWIPSGSEKLFPDRRAKLIFLLLAILLLALALGLPFNEHSSRGLAEGRTAAFLHLGASSKLGVLTVLNAWFGFVQLFFFVALRAGATSFVRIAP